MRSTALEPARGGLTRASWPHPRSRAPSRSQRLGHLLRRRRPPGQSGRALGARFAQRLRAHVVRAGRPDGRRALGPAERGQEGRRQGDRLGGQKLVGYFVDSSVTKVEARPDGSVRAQVSVIVGTYPGRDMRAMLSGAATVSGGGVGESAKVQAVAGRFHRRAAAAAPGDASGLARARSMSRRAAKTVATGPYGLVSRSGETRWGSKPDRCVQSRRPEAQAQELPAR